MFVSVLKKIFGTKSQRDVRRMRPLVARINALEVEYQKLDEAAIKAKTAEFKARLAAGETLDDIMVEAFAVCREAAWRSVGMKHFKVQIIGGMFDGIEGTFVKVEGVRNRRVAILVPGIAAVVIADITRGCLKVL